MVLAGLGACFKLELGRRPYFVQCLGRSLGALTRVEKQNIQCYHYIHQGNILSNKRKATLSTGMTG